MKTILPALLIMLAATAARAAKVDTLSVYSQKMKRSLTAVVYTPEDKKSSKFPVIYLLHGYGDNYTTWPRITDVARLADTYRTIIVCPDGQNSWYVDSPVDPSMQFETFISKELPEYIDAHYPTHARRELRAITGLSMGGHGAMWNGLQHPDVFGNIGTTSGCMDICQYPNCWQIEKVLGNKFQNEAVWKSHSVYYSLDRLLGSRQNVIIDCGYSDFFYTVNLQAHKRLREINVKHDFYVRPGGHTGDYWRNSIDYQMMFFAKQFDKILKQK